MRLVRLSVVLLAAFALGCQKAEEKPAAPAAPATPEKAPVVAPAEVKPATPADTLSVPPAPTEKKAEEPKTDVILPPGEPTPEEPKKEEPKAEEPKKEGSVSIEGESVLTAVAAAEGVGSLTGKFIFDGTPPKPAKLEITKDQEFCGKFPEELIDESIVVGDGGGLANVFVYVRSKIAATPEAEKAVAASVRMDHAKCRYTPHALAVWAGKQGITFGNKDTINHAVKIDPLNPKNPAINNQMPGGVDIEYKFVAEERIPVAITCGIHPWEKGWILPLEHPYLVVSGNDGSFTIDHLPAGKHEFQVWQEKAGYLVAKPEWKRGRFELDIKPGKNDLGAIKVSPKLFEKK